MTLDLIKMQGAGNDYLFFDGFLKTLPKNPRALARRISPRQNGIGADGLVLMLPSAVADAKMLMFNSDGSEGKMCGNAIRCMGNYLFQKQEEKNILQIETLSGIKTLYRHKGENCVLVNMGKAVLGATKRAGVPFFLRLGGVLAYPVSVGNPHLVCFGKEGDFELLERLFLVANRLACFPLGVNVEMAIQKDETTAQVRVIERGSGETLSCGTGAVAVAAVGMGLGYFSPQKPIALQFKGGHLIVKQDKTGDFWLTGDTKTVYEGRFEIED